MSDILARCLCCLAGVVMLGIVLEGAYDLGQWRACREAWFNGHHLTQCEQFEEARP